MNNIRTRKSHFSASRKNPFRALATAAFLSAALALAPLPALASSTEPNNAAERPAPEVAQNPVVAEAAEPDADSQQQPEVQAEVAHIQSNLSAADAAEAVVDTALDASAAFAADSLALSGDGQTAETNSSGAAEDSVETCSLTVYYCEIVFYEDPDFSHPSGMRLLKTRTVEGLTPGDTINPWNYVEAIDGFHFFDGWAENKTLSTDSSKNNVQLNYFATTNNSFSVNYYMLTDGNAPISSQNIVPDNSGAKIGLDGKLAAGDSIIADYYGEPVRITKLGGLQEEGQRFGQMVDGSNYATPIEHMMFLDSYPSSIRVGTDPESNVINMFYAPTLTTPPDETPAPGDGEDGGQTPTPDVPTTPDGDTTPDNPSDGSTPDNPGDGSTPDTPSDGDATTPDNTPDGDDPSQGSDNADDSQGGSDNDGSKPSTPSTTNPADSDEGAGNEQPGESDNSDGNAEGSSTEAGNNGSNSAATDSNQPNGSSNASGDSESESAADQGTAASDSSSTLTQTGDSFAPIAIAVALLAAISLGVVVVARRHLS